MNQAHKQNKKERRNFPRNDYEVKVCCVSLDGLNTFITQSQNISITGICLISKKPLKLGSFYEVMYYDNEKQVKKEVAKAKWHNIIKKNYIKNGLEFWNHHKLNKVQSSLKD